MRRYVFVLIGLLLIISFTGCICMGVTSALLSAIPTAAATAYPVNTSNTDSTKLERNGYDVETNQTYQLGCYSIQVPSYLYKDEQEDNLLSFVTSPKDPDAIIMVVCEPLNATRDEYQAAIDEVTNSLIKDFDGFQTVTDKSITISGFPGKKIYGSGFFEGSSGSFIITHMFDSTQKNLIVFAFAQNDSSTFDYSSDAERIMRSVMYNPPTTTAPTFTPKVTKKPTPKPTPKPTTQTRTGIRPEFQKAMDEYLQFFTEYCSFIKKYTQSPDASMALQYFEFMQHYAEAMEALENIDEKELSPEELKLYLDTTNKINKMLIDLSMGL